MDEGIVTLTSFWSRVPVPSVVVVVVKSCSLVVVVLFTSPATVITLVGLTSISEKVIGELVVARLYITAELLTGTLVTVAFLYASCASLNVVLLYLFKENWENSSDNQARCGNDEVQ